VQAGALAVLSLVMVLQLTTDIHDEQYQGRALLWKARRWRHGGGEWGIGGIS
jgi:hypothetical protein